MPEKKEQSILKLRKFQKIQNAQRVRILVILGILVTIVVALIVWASIRLGGFQNIFKGDSNVISNTVNNIGDSITSTGTPTPAPTEFTVTNFPSPQDQTQDRTENTLVFNTGEDNYSITIKKGTTLEFVNDTGKSIGLLFSDGRQVRVETKDINSVVFLSVGNYTFSDQIDTQNSQITGTVIVVN